MKASEAQRRVRERAGPVVETEPVPGDPLAMGVASSLRPLRIGIDAHTIGSRRSGDESYTLGLLRGLCRVDRTHRYTVYVTNDEAQERLGPLPENFRLQHIWPHQRHTRLLLSHPIALHRYRQDVVHFQYIAPPLHRSALVLTVHDLSYVHMPENFSAREGMALRLGTHINIRRAQKILTVSEFTKRELTRHYGLTPGKIVVTPNAISDRFHVASPVAADQDVCKRHGVVGDFILYVGTLTRRKRPQLLIEAFARHLAEADRGCDLVIVGSKADLYPELLAQVRRAGLDGRVHFLGYVSDEDLPHLYRRATVFVLPSEYEGFGIPIIEAMSSGTPVICSGGSALGEVAGDAALRIDRFDAQTLSQALRRLLESRALRERAREKGLARAQLFSWDDTARRTLRVYEEAFRLRGRR